MNNICGHKCIVKHTHMHTHTCTRTSNRLLVVLTWAVVCCAFVLTVTQLCVCVCVCVCVHALLSRLLWSDEESPGAWWWMGVLSLVRSSCLCAVFMPHVLLLYRERCMLGVSARRACVGGFCVNVSRMKRLSCEEGVRCSRATCPWTGC